MTDATRLPTTGGTELTDPDFERIAARYDRIAPNMQPVTDALLHRLPGIEDGGQVLDIGSGTGEPGLTLARRAPGVQVLGIDAQPAMVAVARRKAAAEPVANARFEVMEAEKLDVATDGVAAVVSQNGLLLFGDPVASAAETARVLPPGGHLSLAVWDRPQLNTFTVLALSTLGEVLEADAVPGVAWMDDLAAPGRRERWLRDAGLRSVHSELFRWTSHLRDFAAVRDLMEIGPFGPFFAGLDADRSDHAYDHLEHLVEDHRAPDGSYRIPMACRLIWGRA